MEDRQNNAPSHEKARSLAKRLEFGPAPFIVGLVVALVFGWWIFPGTFVQQTGSTRAVQP